MRVGERNPGVHHEHFVCWHPKMKKCVLWGIAIGVLAGIVEAMITAIGAPDYWARVRIHWSQIGFAGWAFGGIAGYLVGLRVERRRAERKAKG